MRSRIYTGVEIGSAIAMLVFVDSAHACDREAAAEYATMVAIERDGQPGFFVHRELMLCLHADVAALAPTRELVSLLERRAELSNELTADLRELARVSDDQRTRAVDALEASERLRREAEDELDAWYRSPILWVGIGAAVVVVLELVAVWLIGSAQ